MAFNDLRGPDWPFTLRGRIDRLDYNPETADLVVWDYKSGEIPKKNQVLDEVAEAQLPCYLLAVEQGRVPVGPAAANLRAGFIGLKSPRPQHLKHEDFGATPEKWREAAAAFAAKVTALGRRLAAGDFHPDPNPAPENPTAGPANIAPTSWSAALPRSRPRKRNCRNVRTVRNCHDQGVSYNSMALSQAKN